MFSRNFPFSRETYTLERLKHETIQANEAVETFTGRRPTSFAYPCGQRFVGRGKATRSYVPLVAEHFLVGRGFLDEGPNDPLRCDMAQVNGVAADGRDFKQLEEAIDSALEEGRWRVLVAHDVASEIRSQAMTTDRLAATRSGAKSRDGRIRPSLCRQATMAHSRGPPPGGVAALPRGLVMTPVGN